MNGENNDDRITILVADDDPVTRLLAGEILEREGFAARVVESGEIALALFASYSFDLVLLDVVMPGLDGFDTCARLRQMPAGAHIPILMVTGLDDESSIQRAYGAGATDFITKPLNALILAQRVRYVLRASAAMRELAWRVDFQRVLIETIPVPIVVEDARGGCLLCNPAWETLVGRSLAEMAGGVPQMVGRGIPKPAVLAPEVDDDGRWQQQVYETEVVGAGAEPRSVIVHQAAFTLPASGEPGVISVVLDITERKKSEEHLRLAETVFRTAADAIMVTDAAGVIKSINPAFTTVTGYQPREAIGLTPRLLESGREDDQFFADVWRSLRETGKWSGELWQRRKNGEIYPVWETIAAVHAPDGHVVEYVAFFNDITARKRAEQEVFHRANYDLLTGLPNRNLLCERLDQTLKQARRYSRRAVLMFVDLDGFKQVNDTLGHGVGDMLLCQVAARLGVCVRDTDTVARQGGDEFVVVLPDMADEEDASVVAEKIIARLTEPFDLGGNVVRIGASVGVAFYPDHGASAEQLLRHADLAMYQAKLAGRGAYRIYEPAMTNKAARQASFENNLRLALERKEFAVYYQPILEVDSGRLVGAEALLRWHHPLRGIVPPSEFIALAEETGLIGDIGTWVLEDVCQTLERWHRIGLDLSVSVNLSSVQILRGWSIEMLDALLKRYRLAPHALVFEITEKVLLADIPQAGQWLEDVRNLGIHLVLDDFGTGYSSLSCLRRFPLDRVKIDPSLVRDMVANPISRALVKAILAMSHNLWLKVVAEGVETWEQFDLLGRLGCEYAQGFYFSRPVSAEEFAKIARNLRVIS
ncbi:MAG TPA: EAL domain-containing protein [Candidatus Competibacter sp.]|nr:EAL domain-containing protein [Candidatus Competibacter sp.]